MILVDHLIKQKVADGEIKITNFDPDFVQPASYDLRMGNLIYSPAHPDKPYDMSANGGAYRLPPYGTAIVTTFEDLKLPSNMLGRIGLKSGYARVGLVASTGPQIDPGFDGRLFVTLFNLTARAHILKYRDAFLTIELQTLDSEPTHSYQGPYQGKYSIGPEVLESLAHLEGMTLSQMQSQFTELSEHVQRWSQLAARFDEFLSAMNLNTKAIQELAQQAQPALRVTTEPAEPDEARQLRQIGVNSAADEILELFKTRGRLFYSEIATELSLPLKVVIQACELLLKRGLIEDAGNVKTRPKGTRSKKV